jgi:hypothetical protein
MCQRIHPETAMANGTGTQPSTIRLMRTRPSPPDPRIGKACQGKYTRSIVVKTRLPSGIIDFQRCSHKIASGTLVSFFKSMGKGGLKQGGVWKMFEQWLPVFHLPFCVVFKIEGLRPLLLWVTFVWATKIAGLRPFSSCILDWIWILFGGIVQVEKNTHNTTGPLVCRRLFWRWWSRIYRHCQHNLK